MLCFPPSPPSLWPPPPALAQAPQGPRVEALVGYDAPRIKVNDGGIVGTFKDEGVLYGIGAGYDFALGNGASLGVDVEASDSTVKETNTAGTLKAERDLYAGGRVSFPLGADGSNVYVKGGYTNARFRADFDRHESLGDSQGAESLIQNAGWDMEASMHGSASLDGFAYAAFVRD